MKTFISVLKCLKIAKEHIVLMSLYTMLIYIEQGIFGSSFHKNIEPVIHVVSISMQSPAAV